MVQPCQLIYSTLILPNLAGPRQAPMVQPCQLIYSTLRPTKDFVKQVHQHITAPYLLITDTADEGITHYHAVDTMLSSRTLRHWWAVDNEVSASDCH
jgi:hypothetical protein